MCIILQRLLRNNNLFNCSNFGCKYFLKYTILWIVYTEIFIVVSLFIVNICLYCQECQPSVIQHIYKIRSKTTIKSIFTSAELFHFKKESLFFLLSAERSLILTIFPFDLFRSTSYFHWTWNSILNKTATKTYKFLQK